MRVASVSADGKLDKGTKCAILLNMKTITQRVSRPPDLDNSTIKSMFMCVHGLFGVKVLTGGKDVN